MREYVFGSQGGTGYSGSQLATSSGTATCLNWLAPAGVGNPNVEYLRHWVGQAQNATSNQARIGLMLQASAFPAFPFTVAANPIPMTGLGPRKLKQHDVNSTYTGGTAGATGTVGWNMTGAMGAGTLTTWWEDNFNVLNGYLKVNTPAETEVLTAGGAAGCGLYFMKIPTDTAGWSWGQCFREI